MKLIEPEFHRPLEIARVPPSGSIEKISADPEERAALAWRLGLPAIAALSATLNVLPWRSGGAKVTGALRAEIEQVCVVTLESFNATVREPVERHYLPRGMAGGSEEDDETDEIVNGMVDLGELVTETLALAIDPYPRKPGVEFHSVDESGTSTGSSPFSALASIKPDKH